jgi:uncharacterized membrane protein
MYNVLQFLHVSAAIVWLGSGVGLVALMAVMTRAGDRAAVMTVSRHLEVLGPRLFGPAAMSTLIFGVLMVVQSEGLAFSDLWIVIGLVGVAVSLVFVAVSNPQQKRLAATVEEHGPEHPDVAAIGARLRMINLVDLVVLFVVVWAMVAKPGA